MCRMWPLLLAVLMAARLHVAVEAVATVKAPDVALTLQIVHLNDFHARFDPVSKTAGTCKADPCIGGIARVSAAIKAERNRNPEALVLNAADNYQGTLWYNLFKWNVTAHFMRKIPWDAMTIGNHEFDNGVDGLTPFMKAMQEDKVPFVIANMDDTKEPTMNGLWTPSVVLKRGGRQIGIVGYIWKDTPTIAQTGKLSFSDELAALDKEAGRLKQSGVDVILALSHAGLDVDLAVANATKYADVIVGGHSHTLLYSEDPAPSGEHPRGPYPEVVKQASGRTVLVVQASAYTKYLGNFSVDFDEQGEVVGHQGQPIFLSADHPQDQEMLEDMKPWREEVDRMGKRVLGSTLVTLDELTHDCYRGECSLGNFVSDAMTAYYVDQGPAGSWTAASIGFVNGGGLRSNIEPGNITYSDLVTAQPFASTIDLIDLKGSDLLDTLEEAISGMSLIQWSGLRVTYDYAKPVGQRVVSAVVLCAACDIPRYEPIVAEKWYTVAATSYMVEGGDDYASLKNYRNRRIGPLDVDAIEKYIKTHSPLLTEMDGRLTILNPEKRNARIARHRRFKEHAFAHGA